MRHQLEDVVLQTNLLQAFQKNKIIQGKLSERQKSYYVKLIKEMQIYDVKTKLNRELLYTWKKESYVRQLKKNLVDYERKRFGARDAYYEYQAKNLENLISGGSQGLVIPPIEEKRRHDVDEKFQQFLREHPHTSTVKPRVTQSAAVLPTIITEDDEVAFKKEVESPSMTDLKIAETWSKIHAQSATPRRIKTLPTIHRSKTMGEIRRETIKNASNTPSVMVGGVQVSTPELNNQTNTSPEGTEPLVITSETLQQQTYADLIAMRSVRRPRKNPTDLNMLYEARKRIYHINKRAYEYNLCQRKCGLQYNNHFDKTTDDENEEEIDVERDRLRNEDRHQFKKDI
ncbi:unnamed protein product [Didymodactylos carnosus]|uniref:Uncharacterized protein n=1 Tax=Didymodactylos carnosus TaxID=1234261 RepID=A0A813Y974_9BILA|nr:unnamed protein product [Didymodactylos carnosus]CAF3667094.1 unnamed protein product [Didymodactylos carnosus]